MKKCLFFAAACVCVLAFAMPALADLKITGAVDLDLYYFTLNSERAAGGVNSNATTNLNSRTELHMNIRRPNNYVQFAYTNDNATLGGLIRIRGGTSDHSNFANEQVEFNYSYIWWKPTPATTITFGTQDQIVGGLAPSPTNLGCQDAAGISSPVFINYGNLHSTERTGVTVAQKINSNIGVELGLYDPENDNDAVGGVQPRPAVAGLPQEEENKVPRVDLGIPLTFGNFQTKPKASWEHKKYDQVASNSDDGFDIWAASIDARVTFGPLRLSGEYTYGRNLSEGNYVGATGAATVRTFDYTVTGSADTAFSDTHNNLWWVELKYQIIKTLAFYGAYGQFKGTNDVNPTTAADDWRVKTNQIGIMLEYALFPNFLIYPTYARFDDGDNNLRGNGVGITTDNGISQVYGLKFQLLW